MSGRDGLQADLSGVVEIVGIEILVAIVFASQGGDMRAEQRFQPTIYFSTDASQHRCYGMLRADKNETRLASRRETCHAIGAASLLLIETGGKDMVGKASYNLILPEKVVFGQRIDRKKVVVEIDKLFGQSGYPMQKQLYGGAIECRKVFGWDDVGMQDNPHRVAIDPSGNLTLGADHQEDVSDVGHILSDTPQKIGQKPPVAVSLFQNSL